MSMMQMSMASNEYDVVFRNNPAQYETNIYYALAHIFVEYTYTYSHRYIFPIKNYQLSSMFFQK